MDVDKLLIEKLDLNPGDVLLVKYAGKMSGEMAASIRQVMAEALPAEIKTIVVDRDFDFSILRQTAVP